MAFVVDIDSKIGKLQKHMLKYFSGNIYKVASFAPFHMVATNPFSIATFTNSVAAYDDAVKRNADTDMITRLVVSTSDTDRALEQFKMKSELGGITKSKNKGTGMTLIGHTAQELSLQAAYKVNKDVAALLDATTFATAQKQAATATWSTSATATPRADVNALKSKLYAGSNIPASDDRVHLVLDYTSAVECEATTEYQNWVNNGGASGLLTQEERLKSFFQVPNVVVIALSDNAGTALYSAIVDLMVVDRAGLNESLFLPEQMLIANDSGLLCAFQNQGSFEYGQVFPVTLPNGINQDYTDTMVRVWDAIDAQSNNEIIGVEMFYKPYVHKTEALTGLTGV